MKTTHSRIGALLVAALLVANASAQPVARAEDQIRSLEHLEREAVLAGDTAALERLWADTLIVNNPQSSISADRDVVLGLIRSGVLRYSSFKRTTEAVRIDGDLAIVMGAEEVVRPAEGAAAAAIHRRFTNIWRKKGDRWVMIARHANVIPVSNPSGRGSP